MKVLVTGASKHGNTREIANGIAEELRAAGLDADLREAGSVTSLDGYDAVVLGSAIYMGSWLPEAKHLVERFQPQLVALPVWLFSSGPLGADEPQPAGDPGQIPGLMEQTQARGHRVFTGKLDRAELGFGERLITTMVHAPDGDFRDWEAIRGWADDVAVELKAMSKVRQAARQQV
ncbi:MAG TPA: flavodoxin domain-containing protein [Thermomicrobiales bacterium]|nr:flavodoxin domain-containing protein [Thermomicrobiales bacterium]